MIWASLLLACAGEVVVGYEALACENWDLENSESTFELEVSSTAVTIARTGVFRGCGDEFEPTVAGDDGSIVIHELWTDGGGDCETCWVPTVHIYEPPDDASEVFWFDESSNVTPIWSSELSL